jgi:hypothetical protein
VRLEGLGKLKKKSTSSGTRTGDLPAYSRVPQPTTLPPGIFMGVKSGRRVGLTTLPPSMSRISENMGASTSRNPKGLHGLYRDNFTLPYLAAQIQYAYQRNTSLRCKILKLNVKNFKRILMNRIPNQTKKLNLVLRRCSVRKYPCTNYSLCCVLYVLCV